jgi:RNA polymerase sigma factor (sigma-70 family)
VEKTLGDLIASLPEEERFILTLFLLKGMSNDQIAESLGVPVKSVAAVIKSGKERLLATLDFPPLA